jgi:hypothetical protein
MDVTCSSEYAWGQADKTTEGRAERTGRLIPDCVSKLLAMTSPKKNDEHALVALHSTGRRLRCM